MPGLVWIVWPTDNSGGEPAIETFSNINGHPSFLVFARSVSNFDGNCTAMATVSSHSAVYVHTYWQTYILSNVPGVRVYATFEPWICPQKCSGGKLIWAWKTDSDLTVGHFRKWVSEWASDRGFSVVALSDAPMTHVWRLHSVRFFLLKMLTSYTVKYFDKATDIISACDVTPYVFTVFFFVYVIRGSVLAVSQQIKMTKLLELYEN